MILLQTLHSAFASQPYGCLPSFGRAKTRTYLINEWYSWSERTPPSPPIPFFTLSIPFTAATAPASVVI